MSVEMQMGMSLLQLKSLVVAGLAAWLSLAVSNNIIDPRTNLRLLAQMMSMEEIRQDGILGQGLLWRASSNAWLLRLILGVVTVSQVAIALLLWRAAYLLAFSPDPALAAAAANLGLAGFASLWLFFLCGGMWFGYWLKMPQVQQVHMMLVLIAIGAMVLMNR